MAFKQVKQYQDEIYEHKFRLADDGDKADVIFMYRSYDDVLRASVHYIKSSEYNGYVQCLERDCPICNKGIRVQNKMFVPLYNLTTQEFELWDRTTYFEKQLNRDVFKHYPNPVNFVFTITRKGEAGSKDTKYQIDLAGRNSSMTYDQILEKFNLKMPDAYELICKDYDSAKLSELMSKPANSIPDDELPDYTVTPRTVSSEVVVPSYEPVPDDVAFDSDDDMPNF